MTKKLITKNASETKKLGAKLARELNGGEILALYGELGAGKTTLIQGLAEALGVKEPVTSPTFIVLDVHKLPKTINKVKYFIHIDAYRLKNAEEALGVGITDHLGRPDTVVVIEWAEKLEEILKNYQIKKIIINTISKDQRELIIESGSPLSRG